MPPSRFKPAELNFLRDRIPQWEQLKDRPRNKKNQNEHLKEKACFIRLVIKDFFVSFPEHDPSVSDTSPDTFTEDLLAAFPERLRQWYRNNTRTPGGQPIQEKRTRCNCTHVRNVASQCYHQEINQLACKILAEAPGMERMTAFNNATTTYLEKLKVDDEPAYLKLFKDAAAIRNAAEVDYMDKSPEVLAK
ncbi:hypothetical protein RSAG8_08177, partial [Rhizoctonia solani AG-8 WAC10335]